MKRILATGGEGQVGTELGRIGWPEGYALERIDIAELDLRDPAAIAAKVAEQPWAAVLSVGAYTAVDCAETDAVTAWQVNALAPAAFAQACAERSIPLVHVSTDYVFAGDKHEPWLETDPTRPLGVYGASKLGGELAIRTACPRHAIVRTSWVVSPHGSNFVKTMLRLASERDTIAVVADQHGSPTSAADLADAIATIALRMIADPDAPCGTFHFSNAGATTWHGVAEAVFETAARHGIDAPRVEAIASAQYPTVARRPTNSLLDHAAISHAYGLRPRHWRAAIDEIVSSLLKGSQ